MKLGNLYSASDKALFDALNQRTVSNADLRQLFLTHGIVISKTTTRRELALLYSRLTHDFADFQALSKIFDTGHRRERLASFRVESKAQLEDYEAAAHSVVDQLQSNADAARVSVHKDGSINVHVRYKTFNFNKSEFRQIETRDAVITIEREGGQVVVRGPQNEKVDEICRSLLGSVKERVAGEFEISEIGLENYKKPSLRTAFFVKLIDLMGEYKKHDVTDVYVYKPKSELDDEEEDAGEDATSDDEEEVHLGVHIDRATLKGGGVLQSEEVLGFINKGFYISKIVWKAKIFNEIDSDIYEFEAQFTEPESCTQFSYLAKGYYKYQADQTHSVTRTQLSTEEDVQLSKVIESAARKSLQILIAEDKEAQDD